MEKTNKETLSKFVAEMRAAKNEKNKNLAKIDEIGLPAPVVQAAKKAIRKIFVDKIEEIKSKPGYAEVKQTYAEEIKAKIELSKSKKEKERLQKEYEEALKKADADIIDSEKKYEDAQIAHRGKKETFYGNREAIIKYLKNYLKEDDAEVMGYQGKEVHFSLPAVGNFEGFKLDYFVSDERVCEDEFESNPELEKKSKSMKYIGEILKAVNRYMAELGVETDGDMDYENDLQYWRDITKLGCDAGDCLKEVTGLDEPYWTSDKGVDGRKDSHVIWSCWDDFCYFKGHSSGFRDARLFLGLSD